MGTAPILSPAGDFKFSKDGKFLENKVSASIQVTASNVPGLALAIQNDTNFPADVVNIAKVTAKVAGGTGSIGFDGGKGTVSFDGSAGANAGFGAYAKASDLLKDLDPNDAILSGVTLPSSGVARFVALDWGYNIAAAAKGSVALGFGTSVNFSAKGQSTGVFAVIRGFEKEPGARTAIEQTIQSWMLPRQIESIAHLEPGTWIVAEVDGEFGASIGAQFGYDYSWMRNVNLQGLSGDVGLRIAAAAAISVGFDISGKYLVVVARESLDNADQVARVRLFKMSKKGWNFALNASIGVTGSTGSFLPGQIDDFIAGIFGVHGSQIVKDLQKFRAWTDPNTPLEEKFAGFITNIVDKELKAHAGTEIEKVNEARTLVQGFLDQWESLPHTVSSLVWTQLRQGGEIARDLETGLRLIAGGSDDQIKSQIKETLSDVSFFRSPIGQWLEGAALGRLLSVVENNAEIKNIRESAQHVVDLLDGKILQNLVDFVDQKLKIDLIRTIVSKPPLDALDEWLKSKLTDFIGKKIDLAGLKEIQTTLKTIDSKAADLYKAAVEALNKTWTASVVATYSKATTKTALIDMSFDFGKNLDLDKSLSEVIDGNWKSTLLNPPDGVKINQAVLTHDVNRQSHVELTLPHFNTALDKFNHSAASMTFQVEDGGVYFYELTADDTITRRRKWQSAVSLTSKIAINAKNVNVFPSESALADGSKYAYTLLMPRKNLRTTQLEQLFAPVMAEYFPAAFRDPRRHLSQSGLPISTTTPIRSKTTARSTSATRHSNWNWPFPASASRLGSRRPPKTPA